MARMGFNLVIVLIQAYLLVRAVVVFFEAGIIAALVLCCWQRLSHGPNFHRQTMTHSRTGLSRYGHLAAIASSSVASRFSLCRALEEHSIALTDLVVARATLG